MWQEVSGLEQKYKWETEGVERAGANFGISETDTIEGNEQRKVSRSRHSFITRPVIWMSKTILDG